MRNPKKGSILLLFGAALGLMVLGLAGVGFWIWSVDNTWSPLVEPRIRERQQLGSIRVLARARDGREQWVGAFTSGRSEERQPLKLSEIPPQLMEAIVTLEDPRFLEHGGFDILGIFRAAAKNFLSLSYSQGGSTITQQLVKNVFLTKEKTLKRKFTELVLSALVENRFTKDEILQAYLNEVYLGQIGSVEIHGVGRAADYYFGKKLADLDVHEVALLAAMIAGPGYYSPWRAPDRTRARRDKVLRNLAAANLILPQELDAALAKPLPKNPNFAAPTRAAYLMDALREELVSSYSEEEIVRGGFDVRLALDLELQESAEKTLAKRSAEWKPGTQALFVAADPRDCTIKAYVGGTDYRVTQLDRIRQSRRPIGSLMKPLEVMPLLEDDPTVTLATRLEDAPFTWVYDSGRQKWSPQNYDLKYRGPITLRKTLEESINVPIVRLFQAREPSGLLTSLLEPVRALGLDIPTERALPSALLGAIDQTPRATIGAYLKVARRALGLANDAADFACRLGFSEALVAAGAAPTKVADVAAPAAGTHAAEVAQQTQTAAFGSRGARLVLAALEGGLRRGTGAAFGARLPLDRAWASKTGTSSDKRDSWYVALSPQLVVLAWVGRDDNEITPFTGSTGALPVVADVIAPTTKNAVVPASVPQEAFDWPMPTGLGWQVVMADTGCRPSAETVHKVGASTISPKSATPPPGAFSIEGKTYVYELIRDDSSLEPCPAAP